MPNQTLDLLKHLAARFTANPACGGATALGALVIPFCPPGTVRHLLKAVPPENHVALCLALVDRLVGYGKAAA